MAVGIGAAPDWPGVEFALTTTFFFGRVAVSKRLQHLHTPALLDLDRHRHEIRRLCDNAPG